MDTILLLGVVALGVFAWWWFTQRRRPKPVEDEWVLPPASEAPATGLIAARRRDADAPGMNAPPTATPTTNGQAPAGPPQSAPFTPPSSAPNAPGPDFSAPAPRAAAAPPAAGPPPGGPREFLDRDALLNRNRTFDPRNWDNAPDAPSGVPGAEPVEGELPRFFDRDYLEKRSKERGDS